MPDSVPTNNPPADRKVKWHPVAEVGGVPFVSRLPQVSRLGAAPPVGTL